jgi:hypothetical protein
LTAAAATSHGKLQQVTLGGALFNFTQGSTGLTKGLTTIALLEGAFPGAPSYASCARAASYSPSAHAASLSPKVLQTLRAGFLEQALMPIRWRCTTVTARLRAADLCAALDRVLPAVCGPVVCSRQVRSRRLGDPSDGRVVDA